MHSQGYITCVNTYIHLSISVYMCAHEFRNAALQTCLCPVGMSIHVHTYKYVSVCAETPAGMGSSAQMLFSQRGQQRPDTFASKAQMRKWKVRERPD